MILSLIADTHGHLPAALFPRLAGCDLILHLGDLGGPALLAELSQLAPTLAVRGNADARGLAELPEERRLDLAGLPVALRHHPWTARDLEGAGPSLWAHGHTHVPRLLRIGPALLLCPGALYQPRQGHPASLAIVEIRPEMLQAGILAVEDGRILAQNAWPRGLGAP